MDATADVVTATPQTAHPPVDADTNTPPPPTLEDILRSTNSTLRTDPFDGLWPPEIAVAAESAFQERARAPPDPPPVILRELGDALCEGTPWGIIYEDASFFDCDPCDACDDDDPDGTIVFACDTCHADKKSKGHYYTVCDKCLEGGKAHLPSHDT